MSSPNTPPKVISPSKLAHVVLRTNNFHSMVKFYKTFLGGYAVFENEHIAFITYDDEHHRIAIIHQPHLKSNDGSTTGLEHIAFTFDSLKDLCTAYKQRKEHGIIPGWCVVCCAFSVLANSML
jgi:catechol-2,3-dioxygenase